MFIRLATDWFYSEVRQMAFRETKEKFTKMFLEYLFPTYIKTGGQSYKHFTLAIYESRVVIWGIFKSGTTLES